MTDGVSTRDRLIAYARDHRTDWFHNHAPLTEAVALAKAMSDGPVVLLDHADNVGSGGTSDVMTVIAEVLRQDLQGVAMAAVWDPAAVQAMQQAGVGATVMLDLGGRTPMPSIGFPASRCASPAGCDACRTASGSCAGRCTRAPR